MPKVPYDRGTAPSPQGSAGPMLLGGDDLLGLRVYWLWESGAAGRVSSLSREFAPSTGLPPESLLGRDLRDVAPTGAGFAEQRAAIANRQPFHNLVFKIERKDDSVIWLEIAGAPVRDAEGGFCGYRGIGKTVTAEIEASLGSERYQQLFEVATDWFWETNADGRISYVSPNIEAVLGLPASSYCDKRLAETEGITFDREAGKANLAAYKAREPYRDFVYSRKLPSGRLVWVSTSGAPFYDEQGVFQGYRGVARDVTARIEAEQALRKSEQRFRELYEIGSDYYWECDESLRLTFVSPEAVDDAIWGIPFSERRNKRPTEFMNMSFEPEMGRKNLVAIKNRQPYRDVVFSVKHPDGKIKWVSVSATPVFGENAEFRGYRGVGTDITARIEAEVAMRLMQRQLHDAVAQIHQPLAVFDNRGRVAAYNQAFVDLHRTPTVNTPVCDGARFVDLAEWQVTRDFYALGPDEHKISSAMLIEHYENSAERIYHLRDDRWMMVAYRSLPGDAKLALWTDITALKRAEAERLRLEAQLHHSQRLEALGTLAGGAAHEINNALVPAISLTKLMASKQPEGSRERRNLDLILAGAERSRDLVKQILAFSRKGDEQRKEKVDVAAVLLDALQLLRATIPATINLAQDVSPVPLISGDPGQLHQVIVNLVSNAAQAIGEAVGTITLGLRPELDGRALRLWVADTGCGMDEATKARIFEPFFTTKEVGEGTGLGLAVVHGIIKSHGGRIEVESALGRGTRFDIVLPAAAVETVVAA